MPISTGGTNPGTPLYLAPERHDGHAATPAGDLYALGAALYYAATGQSPPDPNDVLAAPPIPEHLAVLAPLLSGLLDFNPTDRADARTARTLIRAATRPTQARLRPAILAGTLIPLAAILALLAALYVHSQPTAAAATRRATASSGPRLPTPATPTGLVLAGPPSQATAHATATSRPGIPLPRTYDGTWTGTITQGDTTTPVTARITGGTTGHVVGTTTDPTLKCTATITLTHLTPTAATATETLTANAGLCAATVITLTPQPGGTLAYSYPAGPLTSAGHATLRRARSVPATPTTPAPAPSGRSA